MEKKERILIVDDDVGVRKTLKLIFERSQYETEAVGTGKEALKKAKENFFNIAVLDIKLPDMEGVELIAPLKELHPRIVVIMITAFASMETAVQALNDGAAAYIYKPLEMDAVLKTVGDILEKQKLIEDKRRAEEKTKESEEKLKAILASIGDFITIQNKNLDIIWVNQAIKEIWGEVLGKKCFNVYKKLDAPCHDCIAEVIFNEGKTLVSEAVAITPDGRIIYTLATSSPVRDAKGNIVAVVEVVKDISRRKELESQLKEYTENLEQLVEERTLKLKDSEELYRGVYESSIDGIASTDIEGSFIECNQAFADMVGYTKEELYKLTDWDLTLSKWHDVTQKIHKEQVFTKGYSEEYEKEYIKKDGTIFPVSIRTWIIKDKNGNPAGTWGFFRDITERYNLMKLKDQFISIATHELRTPLISIKGYIDFLLSEDKESIANLIKPSLEVVRRNTDRLIHLTDDLLDVQRIKSERLPLNLEPLNLTELMNNCNEELKPFIREKKQNFHLEVPDSLLIIQGDHIRLSQAVMNLLNNATKYTPEGGNITLTVEEKDDIMQVQISDTGIGIQQEDFDKVFQPFTNIKKPNHVKGTGLGLSVTKGLIEAHGGKIWVYSEGEGKGATFTFTLPKQKVTEVS